jgi:hypothetical protein
MTSPHQDSERERGAEKHHGRARIHRMVNQRIGSGSNYFWVSGHLDGCSATGIFLEYKENDKKTKRYQKLFEHHYGKRKLRP